MPLIKIISTGGTIANTSRGLISIGEVLKDIPQARSLADFEITEATRVRSGSIRLAQWFEIACAVSGAAAPLLRAPTGGMRPLPRIPAGAG